MGWLGWVVTFLALGLLALAMLGLLALRLWRAGKALGSDLARVSSLTASVGSVRDQSGLD